MIPENLKDYPIAAAVDALDAGAIRGGVFDRNELALEIAPERIVAVCRYLKEREQFVRLSAVTAVDWYPAEPRFEVVYLLHSIARNERLRLKCRVGGERPEIDSVTGVWRAANWYEREVFDLFGVRFRNHPDLRRLLMPEDWEGHPLRKDYPVTGTKYTYTEEPGGPQ
jgi:NADH-quinone oxidoreductase subunit C